MGDRREGGRASRPSPEARPRGIVNRDRRLPLGKDLCSFRSDSPDFNLRGVREHGSFRCDRHHTAPGFYSNPPWFGKTWHVKSASPFLLGQFGSGPRKPLDVATDLLHRPTQSSADVMMIVLLILTAHPSFDTPDPESRRIPDRRRTWVKTSAGYRAAGGASGNPGRARR